MNRELLYRQLEIDEDRRNKLYRCSAGKLTIGVGRNIEDLGLSDDEIDYLLRNDVKRTEEELDRNLPWWRNMNDARQRVLANMCFNLGISRLLKFVNTLAAMESGNYQKAAAGMKASLWATQVGERADRLIKMMKEGV